MADIPIIRGPYPSMISPFSYDRTNDVSTPPDQVGKVPSGANISKQSRADMIIQGLIGAR